MRTKSGARKRSREVSSSLPCIGPSASSRSSEKSSAKTSTVKTRAWRVRSVERRVGGGVAPICDGGGAKDPGGGGEVAREPLDDDGVASQREVGAVLLA